MGLGVVQVKMSALGRNEWAVVLLLSLGACSSTPDSRTPVPVDVRNTTKVDSQERHKQLQASQSSPAIESDADGAVRVYGLQARKVPAQAVPSSRALPSRQAVPSPQSPAVVALLGDAERRLHAGEHAAAAASLERALRLEPRNGQLWYRLATVRLAQGSYQEAVQLATKSNSLAGGDRGLRLGNWRLIAEAREHLGDKAGADGARRKAEKLERTAS